MTLSIRVQILTENIRVRDATSVYCKLDIGNDHAADGPKGTPQLDKGPLYNELNAVTSQETQERIRKRIREDLKEAIHTHNDYAENVFPKLRRTYMKKSQDVEVRMRHHFSLSIRELRFVGLQERCSKWSATIPHCSLRTQPFRVAEIRQDLGQACRNRSATFETLGSPAVSSA